MKNTLLMSFFMVFYLMAKMSNNHWINGYIFMNSFFGITEYSFMLILLTAWLYMISNIMLANNLNKNIIKMIEFLTIILILCFLSKNLLWFFCFFEASLIPTFMIIVNWGLYPERMKASYFMLFYTLFFSFPLLLMIFKLDLDLMTIDFFMLKLMVSFKTNIFELMFLISGFLVKLPMFLIHSWLPKAHVEAPVFGSMFLAGILLKLGGYGLMKFLLFLDFNDYNMIFSISMIGMISISMICLRMIDMKATIAYSSIIHMGMMICSIMTLYQISFISSYMMMVAHGLISSGMFYLANEMYKNSNSRLFKFNKGILNNSPNTKMLWFMLCSSNMAAPISLNLISEILMISSILSFNYFMIPLLMISMLLSSFMNIYLYTYLSHSSYNYSKNIKLKSNINNYMIIFMHWLPANILFFKLNLFLN